MNSPQVRVELGPHRGRRDLEEMHEKRRERHLSSSPVLEVPVGVTPPCRSRPPVTPLTKPTRSLVIIHRRRPRIPNTPLDQPTNPGGDYSPLVEVENVRLRWDVLLRPQHTWTNSDKGTEKPCTEDFLRREKGPSTYHTPRPHTPGRQDRGARPTEGM